MPATIDLWERSWPRVIRRLEVSQAVSVIAGAPSCVWIKSFAVETAPTGAHLTCGSGIDRELFGVWRYRRLSR